MHDTIDYGAHIERLRAARPGRDQLPSLEMRPVLVATAGYPFLSLLDFPGFSRMCLLVGQDRFDPLVSRDRTGQL